MQFKEKASERLSVRIKPSIKKMFQDEADKHNVSQSELLEAMIIELLGKGEKNK